MHLKTNLWLANLLTQHFQTADVEELQVFHSQGRAANVTHKHSALTIGSIRAELCGPSWHTWPCIVTACIKRLPAQENCQYFRL